jgi:AraC-like DNA-binding protein
MVMSAPFSPDVGLANQSAYRLHYKLSFTLVAVIGKTRQPSCAQIEEVCDPEVGRARGILRRPLPGGKLSHARRRPPPDLACWIAHYWMITWDLRGYAPHIAETLAHPNIHVVFEKDSSVVSGIQTRKFSRLLEGRSQVFGIKFKPGGFRPFLKSPVSSLADRTVPAKRIFGKAVDALTTMLASSGKESEKVSAANAFFRARLPEPDDRIALAGQLVARILAEPNIKTVNDLATLTGVGKRSLERLFSDYVGASPKWVIRRYRLHELVEKFDSRTPANWAQLALDLGYFDQAHLINDFKSIVGCTPTQYQRQRAKHS